MATHHRASTPAPDLPQVLFVCVHNAGRSQMAAALFNHHAAGRALARSAGSAPAPQVNPVAVQALADVGLDLSGAVPRPLQHADVENAEVVVTMGCGDACPVLPATDYRDWQLPDPAGQDLAQVRLIRDEIDRRVQELLGELLT